MTTLTDPKRISFVTLAAKLSSQAGLTRAEAVAVERIARRTAGALNEAVLREDVPAQRLDLVARTALAVVVSEEMAAV